LKQNELEQKDLEARGYFRVDDVFPVISRKVTEASPYRKSKVFPGYSMEISYMDVSDGTINPQLWKMLVDINTKLGLILEHLQLESEGLIKAEDMPVNISASGIRFKMKEKVDIGDVIEIKMLLPTYPPVGILTYGNIVQVNDLGNGEYEVALYFSDMDDEVKDEIIQYALKRQREILRKNKQQLDVR